MFAVTSTAWSESPKAVWEAISDKSGASSCQPVLFDHPSAIAADSKDNLYVTSEEGPYVIRKITPDGQILPLLTRSQIKNDGHGSYTGLSIALDKDGNIFIAVDKRKTIEKVNADGTLSLVAGQPGKSGMANGDAKSATFKNLKAIAIDASKSIYVTDSKVIRKVTATDKVSILAGKETSKWEYVDAKGAKARFPDPHGLAVDKDGNVLIADGGGKEDEGKVFAYGAIRKINTEGKVETVVGSSNVAINDLDGTGAQADIPDVYGIAIAKSGEIYVTEIYSAISIRQISAKWEVSGLFATDSLEPMQLDEPVGIVAASDGNLYVVASKTNKLFRIDTASKITTLCLPVIKKQ